MPKKTLVDNRKFGDNLTNNNQSFYSKKHQIFDDIDEIDSVNLIDDFQYTRNGENIVYINEIYEFLKLREVHILFELIKKKYTI